jgi:hypothetical protein
MRLGVVSKPRQILFLAVPDLAVPDFQSPNIFRVAAAKTTKTPINNPIASISIFRSSGGEQNLVVDEHAQEMCPSIAFCIINYRRMHDIKRTET